MLINEYKGSIRVCHLYQLIKIEDLWIEKVIMTIKVIGVYLIKVNYNKSDC